MSTTANNKDESSTQQQQQQQEPRHEKSIAPQLERKKKKGGTVEPLYPCQSCHQRLGRHRFQKKMFRKFLDESNQQKSLTEAKPSTTPASHRSPRLVCHMCVREETARRCKQAPPKALRTDASVAESGTKRRPNNFGYCDYVDKLFRMECFATTIAPLRVFRSAKDVSESMAALQAILNHGSVARDNDDDDDNDNDNNHDGSKVLCLCIGDGCTPQTAVLVSFLTKGWECVSIDPALSEDWNGTNPHGVQGLYGYKGRLDEFLADPDRPAAGNQRWRHLILVCVHSHARFVEEASVDSIRHMYSSLAGKRRTIPPTTIVSLPCCPTFRHVRDIGRPPDIKYDDDCVFSACRSVEVWNFLEENCDENDPPFYCTPGNYCSVIPAPTTMRDGT